MWIILIAICYFRSWWVMFRFIQIHISSLKILIHVNHYRYVSILFFVAVRINIVNGLPVRFLEKAVSGYDFTKTQLTGTVSGF